MKQGRYRADTPPTLLSAAAAECSGNDGPLPEPMLVDQLHDQFILILSPRPPTVVAGHGRLSHLSDSLRAADPLIHGQLLHAQTAVLLAQTALQLRPGGGAARTQRTGLVKWAR